MVFPDLIQPTYYQLMLALLGVKWGFLTSEHLTSGIALSKTRVEQLSFTEPGFPVSRVYRMYRQMVIEK